MLEFNILLTSFLNARKYELENKFSVACWKPNWCQYKDIDFLFPLDVNGIRLRLSNCNNSIDEYVKNLREAYTDRWELIENWLDSLQKDKQYILCCWCPNSSTSKEQLRKFDTFFCHTTLIGKMIRIHRPDLVTKLDFLRETKSVPSTIDWYNINVEKIISGGQTGADEAGLIIGKELGLKTGGWMTKEFRTSEGKKPEFKQKYDMQEHSSYYYSERTYANVKDSDGTVRFATNFYSAGELCTLKAIKKYDKPYFDFDLNKVLSEQIVDFVSWLKCYNIKTLNVAGNSQDSSPGIQEKTVKILKIALS